MIKAEWHNKGFFWSRWIKIPAVLLHIVSAAVLAAIFLSVLVGVIGEQDVWQWMSGTEEEKTYFETEEYAGQVFRSIQHAVELTWLEQVLETDGKLDLNRVILKVQEEDGSVTDYKLGEIVRPQLGGGFMPAAAFLEMESSYGEVTVTDNGALETESYTAEGGYTTDTAENGYAPESMKVLWFALGADYAPEYPETDMTGQPRFYDRAGIGWTVLSEVEAYQSLKKELKEEEHNFYYAVTGSVEASNGKSPEEIQTLGSFYQAEKVSDYYREEGNLKLFEENGYNAYYGAKLVLDDYYVMTEQGDCLYVGVDTGFKAEDGFAGQKSAWDWKQSQQHNLLMSAAKMLGAFLLSFLYLVCAAGKTGKGKQTIRLNFFDKIPFELLILTVILLLAVNVAILEEYSWSYYRSERLAVCYQNGDMLSAFWESGWLMVACLTAGLTSFYLLALAVLLRFVRRHRDGSSCTLIGMGWKWLRRISKQNVKLTWQVGLAVMGELLLIVMFSVLTGAFLCEGEAAFLLTGIITLILTGAVTVLLIRKAQEQDRLLRVTGQLVAGQLSSQPEPGAYSGVERKLAEHISHIRDGLETAVEQAMKNERMKTELISNVSHDIKTPLTSIINYIDLLKRELAADAETGAGTGSPETDGLNREKDTPEKLLSEEQQEHIRQYLEVLDQKSKRLKVLTEDLVEASKASSGVLQITPEKINLVELVAQVNGEFEEKFAGRQLTLLSELPPEPAHILADGRRVWRILENLYQNVYKYAMAGTRVYVAVCRLQEGKAVFTIKNISAEPLTVSAEELTERFVRGDASRSSEGSGLGLSIARSLTELQKGSFEVTVDGDLFRVTVTFPEWTDKVD